MASPFDRVGGASSTATGEQLGSAGFAIYADAGSFFDTIGKAETAARRASAAIGQQFGRGGNASMGLLYLGQAVDDAQYGFRSIVNNIPQLVFAIGGGAGMAGAVGIAAVAVNQLMQHWGDLAAIFDGGATKREAEDMAALAENTERAAKNAGRLLSSKPGYHGESDKATDKIIIEAPAEAVMEGIKRGLEKENPFSNKVMIKGVLDPETGLMSPDQEAEQVPGSPGWNERRRQYLEENAAKAKLMLGDMGNADNRQRIMDMIAKNPGDFPAGLGDKLKGASPEAMIEKALADKKAKEWEGERKATDELNKAKQEQAKKIRDHIREEIEAKKGAIDDQVKALEKQREKIQEEIHNRPHYQVQSSVHDMINSMTTERMNKIPNQQLDQLKAIKAGIEKLNEKKAGIQRGAVFN